MEIHHDKQKAINITNILLENINYNRIKLAKALTSLNQDDINIPTH